MNDQTSTTSSTDAAPPVAPSAPALVEKSSIRWGAILKGLVFDRRFLVAALLLLVCAIGFNTVAQALQLHFRKQRVELRVPALDDKVLGIPRVIGGRWVQLSVDRPMSPDLEKALGTKEYVNSRVYLDIKASPRRITVADALAMKEDAAARLVQEVALVAPEAVLSLHIAYYSGLVDTVAHIPDRCMVADGYRPTDFQVVGIQVPTDPAAGADAPKKDVSYRFLTFEDTTAQARVTRNVGYLFHVNGVYTESPYEVRKKLQNLFETYGYYAKVEVMTQQPGKSGAGTVDKSRKAMNEFLAALLPETERCLPDWNAVTGRGGTPAPTPANPSPENPASPKTADVSAAK